MTAFPHLRTALMRHPWAIEPDALSAICEVVERRVSGVRLSIDEIALIKGERQPNGTITMFSLDPQTGTLESAAPRAAGGGAQGSGIAVISVFGIIAQHASQVDDISGPGGTSTDRIWKSVSEALANPAASSIVLNIDSPGGSVNGVQALAAEIFKARSRKPIIAQVNSLAASAAYWIASACSEIVMTPGATAGSIGVYGLHTDVSEAAKRQGLKFTYVSAGKYKVEGNPYEPLGDVAYAAQKRLVDGYYGDFTRDVARGRAVKIDEVRNGFGEGRVVKDTEAVRLRMADRVGTLDATLQSLMKRKPSPTPVRNAAQNVRDGQGIENSEMRMRRQRLRMLALQS
jgi:signal peptide peptidase SppA